MNRNAKSKARARKGQGCIRTVRPKNRSKAYYRAELSWTVDGRTEERVRQFSTYAAAEEQLDRWKIERGTTGVVPSNKQRSMTVEQAIESYKADAKIGNRGATARWHKSTANSPLLKPLFGIRLLALQREDIRSIATSDVKSKKTGNPLGQRSRQAVHNFLKAALSRQPLLQPRLSELFPKRSTPRVGKREIYPWSPSEARTFLGKIAADPLVALYVLALGSGARQGELLGLKWRDVDLSGFTITRSVGPSDLETKNVTSRRRVDLDADTIWALNAHRSRLEADGYPAGPNAWVFPSATQRVKHMHSSTVSHAWAALMGDLRDDVPTITFHDVRHTHASLLLQAGVNVKVIQERLGHKSISITLDVYGHLIPSMQVNAAKVIGGILHRPVTVNGSSERDAA